MNIIVSYRRFEAKNGHPISVKVGDSEIYTDKLILENISGAVSFSPGHKDRHGTTAPLIIPIMDGPLTIDFESMDPGERKRVKERMRYIEKNPVTKRYRKPLAA